MSSLVHASTRQFAVISVRPVPCCERLVIAYSNENTLRDLLAGGSIVGLGYRSREEAQATVDEYATAGRRSCRLPPAAIAANSNKSVREFVTGHILSKGKRSLAKTQGAIWGFLQQSFSVFVVVFYSKNALSTAIRALISF